MTLLTGSFVPEVSFTLSNTAQKSFLEEIAETGGSEISSKPKSRNDKREYNPNLIFAPTSFRIPTKKLESKLIIDPYSYRGQILHPPAPPEEEPKIATEEV